jgi:hypothetical protein
MVKVIKQRKRGTSPMYAFISPLNDDFIRLGSAAALVARARQRCTADDIKDLFKRALSLGEFDPLPDKPIQRASFRPIGFTWRLPPCTLPPGQAALTVLPRQTYALNRESIVSVLHSTDDLPGDYAHWDTLLFSSNSPHYRSEDAFTALAAIPYRDFPERGRVELEAIFAPKIKLVTWSRQHGQAILALLAQIGTSTRSH